MTVRFLSPARLEWLEAIDYYNGQRMGLGYEFVLEVDKAIERVRLFPNTWVHVSKRTRRVLVDRFPYGILYHIDGDVIIITAVMNLRKRPEGGS